MKTEKLEKNVLKTQRMKHEAEVEMKNVKFVRLPGCRRNKSRPKKWED